MRQDQRHAARCLVLLHQLILCQKITSFGMALPQQLAIAVPTNGKQGIVSGGAQVAAQPAQHLVTQETRHWVHAVMLHRDHMKMRVKRIIVCLKVFG